jgi:hypothetical protein
MFVTVCQRGSVDIAPWLSSNESPRTIDSNWRGTAPVLSEWLTSELRLKHEDVRTAADTFFEGGPEHKDRLVATSGELVELAKLLRAVPLPANVDHLSEENWTTFTSQFQLSCEHLSAAARGSRATDSRGVRFALKSVAYHCDNCHKAFRPTGNRP